MGLEAELAVAEELFVLEIDRDWDESWDSGLAKLTLFKAFNRRPLCPIHRHVCSLVELGSAERNALHTIAAMVDVLELMW